MGFLYHKAPLIMFIPPNKKPPTEPVAKTSHPQEEP